VVGETGRLAAPVAREFVRGELLWRESVEPPLEVKLLWGEIVKGELLWARIVREMWEIAPAANLGRSGASFCRKN
jgi:hypothetical protein